MKLFLIITLLQVIGCSSNKNKDLVESDLHNINDRYRYLDKSGKYTYQRQVLVEAEKKKISNLIKLFDPNKVENNILEKIIVVSELGAIKKGKEKKSVMRPQISQYTGWFEGKKFASQIKFDAKKRTVNVIMESPEAKWNGEKNFDIPKSKMLYCFFTQVPECIKYSHFFEKLKSDPRSKLPLTIIWESYPFFVEQIDGIAEEVFTPAVFYFEGETPEGYVKFNLEINGQVIFYQFNKKMELMKTLWVTQGISILK